jgi:soluble lytic murein transglycosylase-like protein
MPRLDSWSVMLRLIARPVQLGVLFVTGLSVGACMRSNTTIVLSQPVPMGSSARASAARPASSRTAPVRQTTARPAPAHPAPMRPAVDSSALERAVVARFSHRPLAVALARRTRNAELADRAAAAVVREAARLRMSPSVLGAVLLIENRGLDSSAVSGQGAVGLMQVMPMHAGSYGCVSRELREVDANICHGSRLLHRYLKRTGSMQIALRRYNGCVRGTNTPRCERYPGRVLRTAAGLRRDMLNSAAEMGLIVPASVSIAPRAKEQPARART